MIIESCMKCMIYAGILLSVLVSGLAAASDSRSADVACPSLYFHQFIKVFMEDANVQRKFTKFPLKKMRFDFKSKYDAKKVILLLEEKDDHFPIIPPKKERKDRDLQIESFSADAYGIDSELLRDLPEPLSGDKSYQEMIAIKSDKQQIFYNFEKTDACWNLVSIDDKTLISEDGKVVPNWLEWIFFQRPETCLPLMFYYDTESKRSNTGILEKLGYTQYKDDLQYAYFTINEKFYGLDANEMLIPTYGSEYSVVILANAHTLSDAIFRKTGKRFQVATASEFQQEFGVPYIFPIDDSKSLFVCSFNF
ncbi:MAG: hypothetical protein FWH15_06625 [Betaproteobacteria bacterium]|nr:hypothetical protein [Betaproteobacteria bacterium]